MNDARNETIPRKWPSDQDRPRQTKVSSLVSSWMWPPFPNSPSNKKETEANLNAYWKTKENGPPSAFSSLSFTGFQYFSWKKKKRTASLCSSLLARLLSPKKLFLLCLFLLLKRPTLCTFSSLSFIARGDMFKYLEPGWQAGKCSKWGASMLEIGRASCRERVCT